MNILFFLTPKSDVAYINQDDTVRQVLEKMEYHRYSSMPIINQKGEYIGTITEGRSAVRYQKPLLSQFPRRGKNSDLTDREAVG